MTTEEEENRNRVRGEFEIYDELPQEVREALRERDLPFHSALWIQCTHLEEDLTLAIDEYQDAYRRTEYKWLVESYKKKTK